MTVTTACGGSMGRLPDMEPPVAERRPHTLISHGHERQDPYFWLRDDDRNDPVMLKYLEAENDYFAAAMKPVAGLVDTLYEELKGRLDKDDSSVPVLRDSYWYYHRYDGREHPLYCRKKGSKEAAEEVFFDVNEYAEKHDYYKVGALEVSPNEHLLAFAEDTVSRRIYTLRFLDMRTGEVLPDVIEGTAGAVAWAQDDKTVFYVRRDPQTLRAESVWRHVLGTDPKDDVMVFEEKDETFYVTVWKSKSKRFVFAKSSSTLSDEVRYVDANTPDRPLVPVVPRGPRHEYSVWHRGEHFYLRTNKDALNFRLVRAPIGQAADVSTWEEVIPHRDDVLLLGLEVFDKFLVASERKEALRQLRVMPVEDGPDEHYVSFDEALYTAYLGENPQFDTTTLRFRYSSPITPSSVFDYDLVSRKRTLMKQDRVLGGYDAANYTSARVWATARDGERVPISVVHRKDTPIDGTAPLYQYGYGSYGHSLDPYFVPSRVSLMDRGFVVATAHVRGGEELGRRWYELGKLKHKMNTFTDFVDCTRHLIAERWAHPKKVIAAGGSAGGLLMGAVINLAPELYLAAHAAVPFVDVVSTMLDDTIPLTTFEYDEWGNPNVEADYHTMLAYSPYDQVKAQDYPHLIITTGLHDSQVQYWEPAKWIAKLRAEKTDDNLLVMKTDMSAGHGGKAGRFERYKETAEIYAFFLWVLGKADPDV